MVVCKRLHGSVQVVAVIRSYGWSVQAAMWWCASGYVVVAYSILVSAQGPLVLGFWVWGLRVWGQGLTISGKRHMETKTEDIHHTPPPKIIFRIKH